MDMNNYRVRYVLKVGDRITHARTVIEALTLQEVILEKWHNFRYSIDGTVLEILEIKKIKFVKK